MALLFSAVIAAAKGKQPCLLRRSGIETAVNVSGNGNLAAISGAALQNWVINRHKRNWHVGLGVRFTTVIKGAGLRYTTASAHMMTNKNGLSTIFSKRIEQNMDTLTMPSSQLYMCNAAISLQHAFAVRWNASLSLDLAGLAFGSYQDAMLTYGEKSNAVRSTPAKPTLQNLFLGGRNDRGSLNAELLLGYQYNQRVCFRAGVSLLQTEYSIDRPVLYTTSVGTVVYEERFRNRAVLFTLGASYRLTSKTKLS